jgi:hypothetical protein
LPRVALTSVQARGLRDALGLGLVAVEARPEEERDPTAGHTLCLSHLEESRMDMEIVLGMLILLAPLLVILTVLASLGWLVLAVLASLGWLGKRLLRVTGWGAHD